MDHATRCFSPLLRLIDAVQCYYLPLFQPIRYLSCSIGQSLFRIKHQSDIPGILYRHYYTNKGLILNICFPRLLSFTIASDTRATLIDYQPFSNTPRIVLHSFTRRHRPDVMKSKTLKVFFFSERRKEIPY